MTKSKTFCSAPMQSWLELNFRSENSTKRHHRALNEFVLVIRASRLTQLRQPNIDSVGVDATQWIHHRQQSTPKQGKAQADTNVQELSTRQSLASHILSFIDADCSIVCDSARSARDAEAVIRRANKLRLPRADS